MGFEMCWVGFCEGWGEGRKIGSLWLSVVGCGGEWFYEVRERK